MFKQTNEKVLFVLNSKCLARAPGGFQTGHCLRAWHRRVASHPFPILHPPFSLSHQSLSLISSICIQQWSVTGRHTHARALAVMARASDAITVSQTKPTQTQFNYPGEHETLRFPFIYLFCARKMPFFVMAKQNMSVLEPQEKLMEALGQTVSALMLNAG